MTGTPERQYGYIEVNDARLFYESSGEGLPIILVHAGICDHRMWDGQVPALNLQYRVIRCDLRGYGTSEMPVGDFSHTSDMEGLLEALGIEKAVLVGCSMGGRVVVELALDNPENVIALVLVTASVSGYDFEAEAPPQWDEMLEAFKAGNFEQAAELDCQIWVDGARRKPEDVDPKLRQKVIEMDKIALENEARQLGQEVPRPPAAPRLGEITVPTLIIAGELDQSDLIQTAQAMHAGIQASQLVVMKSVAHLPNMEKQDEFNQIVLEFLSGLNE